MDKETMKRRLREAEVARDILLHQLVKTIERVDKYKEMLEETEEDA